MDFETIKLNAQRACEKTEKDLMDAKKVLDKTGKRLLNEKALLSRLETQKEKLTGKADDSLSGNDADYQKYKTSLRKLAVDIESTSDAVETLEKTIIPNQKKAVEAAKGKLYSTLCDFVRAEKVICEVDMCQLIEKIIQLQDNFITTFDKIFADYNFQFIIHDKGIIPIPKHSRLDKFSVIARTVEQRQAAMKPPEMPVSPSEPVQDAETSSEGGQCPPLEPETAKDATGTPSGNEDALILSLPVLQPETEQRPANIPSETPSEQPDAYKNSPKGTPGDDTLLAKSPDVFINVNEVQNENENNE
jgi:hypothetical protein